MDLGGECDTAVGLLLGEKKSSMDLTESVEAKESRSTLGGEELGRCKDDSGGDELGVDEEGTGRGRTTSLGPLLMVEDILHMSKKFRNGIKNLEPKSQMNENGKGTEIEKWN